MVIPGSNYVLIQGANHVSEQSQTDLIQNVFTNTEASSSNHDASSPINTFPSTSNQASPSSDLRNHPITFIADADSLDFGLDTGVDRFIVNDLRLLTNISLVKHSLKRIGGNKVSATAI